LKIKYLKSKKS